MGNSPITQNHTTIPSTAAELQIENETDNFRSSATKAPSSSFNEDYGPELQENWKISRHICDPSPVMKEKCHMRRYNNKSFAVLREN